MVSISIELTEDEADRLKERARLLSMPPEALAAAVVRDQLNADAEFDELAKEIVEKNRDLYARLA